MSNSIIDINAKIGDDVKIMHNCIIEEDVVIGNHVYIDSNTIIRRGTIIGDYSYIAADCIIGEYQMSSYEDRNSEFYSLKIGDRALIRSGTIIYSNSKIGDNFQTGHRVTIREKNTIGNNVSIGTLSDIQDNCKIGNYVRLHSNVFLGQLTEIEDYVWIFPHVILTNDPTPPSNELLGVHIKSFAIIAAGFVLLPGITIEEDSLVGAGSVVTKNVQRYSIVAGNPAKYMGDIRNVKNKITGENAYPWREHFERGMPWSGTGYDKWMKM